MLNLVTTVKLVKKDSIMTPKNVQEKLEGVSNQLLESQKPAALTREVFDLQKFYQFDDISSVVAYLDNNDRLISLLEQIPQKIAEYLPDSKLFLNVETDEEITDYVRLYVWVVSHFEPEEAFEKLKAFKYDWWFDVSKNVKGKLFVAIDYRWSQKETVFI
jgi:biotin synthase-related radical SAM superfamily protein